MRVERWTLNSGDVTTYVPWLAQNPPPTCFPSYVCLGRCPLGPLFKEKTRYLRSLSSIIDVFCPIVHYGSHQGGCGSVKDFTSYNPQRREAPLMEEPIFSKTATPIPLFLWTWASTFSCSSSRSNLALWLHNGEPSLVEPPTGHTCPWLFFFFPPPLFCDT